MIRKGLCVLVLVCAAVVAKAQNEDLMQQDSLHMDTARLKGSQVIAPDTTIITSEKPVTEITTVARKYNPRRASLLAAVLPGTGQIYTRKYWKVPLVWGGFGLLIWGTSFSAQQHAFYKDELFQKLNYPNVELPDRLTETQLRSIVNAARRQRDYFLIINFFWYVLQIVDAHVDAHLKEFDLNPNLQVRLETVPLENTLMGRSTGLGLVYKF